MGMTPRFKKPKDMQEKIDDYFSNPPTKTVISRDGVEAERPIISITGLCLHLGFESRQSFYDYESKDDFSYTIKRARLSIENQYEGELQYGNTTGAIFALKNMGWYDKVINENTNIEVSHEEWLESLE